MVRLSEAFTGNTYQVIGNDLSIGDLAESLIPGTKLSSKAVDKFLDSGKFPAYALIDVDQGKDGINLPAEGFHWIVITAVTNGRVHFKDPNRVSKRQLDPAKPVIDPKTGQPSKHPLEKYRYRPDGYQIDEQTGLASMPVETFKNLTWSIVKPTDQRGASGAW